MKLIIDAPDEIVKKGFEGPLTDEERQILIRAIGNGTTYKVEGDLISRSALEEELKKALDFASATAYIRKLNSLEKTDLVKLALNIIDNAQPASDRYDEGYAQGYIDGSTGADWKGGAV
jgi:hypothetical protein